MEEKWTYTIRRHREMSAWTRIQTVLVSYVTTYIVGPAYSVIYICDGIKEAKDRKGT
jgi:hypothetical protein